MSGEIAFSNTKEGMHIRAKELKIKAYNLGCDCYQCNKEFDDVLKYAASENVEIIEHVIWNAAIEAAASLAQWSDVAAEIRKLKK